MVSYNFKKIEAKWKKAWADAGIFRAKHNSKKKKFYCLEMLPYPSGVGLHMGHARNYSIGDSYARFKRMRGFNVLYPTGWDSFGLPSENAAISKGIHPTKSIAQNIKVMKNQFNAIGSSYDWDREIATHDPEYYKWDQWLFLTLMENGLIYRKKSLGNWCPKCKTTLANEDVKGGLCWRCDSEVVQKKLDQWFAKTTEYADELLEGLNEIEFSNKLKALQTNWIGKSQGVEVYFKESETKEILPVFTTRPDTLYSCTFLVFAPEHQKIKEWVVGTKYEKPVREFLERTKKLNELDRISKDKEGLFIGKYAINPANGEKIPIYIANFVILSYGTGIVLADAHDQRDFEFAKKYDIPLKFVISPDGKPSDASKANRAYTNDGILFNSRKFSGMHNREALPLIIQWLVDNKDGRKVTNYKLRDWNLSRQRYWGAPIPIIYCEKCGVVPVPKKDLPIKLPLKVDFSKKGSPPLATNNSFVNVKCPKCNGPGRRETDTMTTFVDSSWYFLRYCDPHNDKQIFDKKKVNYWMPVDQYIGGIEHAVGHLLYSRFITRFLNKLGYIDFKEPFKKLLNQGYINLGGTKMSKSKGNVVDPVETINKYGADTLRTYLLFVAQPDSPFEWSEKDILGIQKFITKVSTMHELEDCEKKVYTDSITQKKIQKVTEYIEEIQCNKALIELIDLSNTIEKYPSKYAIKTFLKMLAPIAPHVCEEVWHLMGEKTLIATESWPTFDKKKINEKVEKTEELLDKTAEDIQHICKIVGKDTIKKICLYVIPPECKQYENCAEFLIKKFKANISVFAVNDPKKFDPQGKAKKAKPGRPAIYLE
jgi:leucyl-tRNA synthetase